MQQSDRPKLITWLSLLAAITVVGWGDLARSQVVPDATLGNGNNSTMNVNGIRTDINGGLRRGSSLFHSFDRFNIPTNFQVYFGNPAGIRNIFSRVTGRGSSNIDGVLGVSGAANLYFMNPNGIIFGPNARLDISGSFFATTANAIAFPDNQRFASNGDRAVPLVEVNIPIGLQFGANPPAMLTNRGNLAVGAGQNLSLVGGTTTNTGSLTAPGGTVQVLGNQVALLEQSRIDVSSPTGGGTVLVGGDYQGRGPILNAQSTTVGPDAVIKADALESGNGGKVIVWADGDTRFDGTISARGGERGGNGGFVEVSGKQRLGFQGFVDTRAPLGQPGTLLLDPANITIAASGGNIIPQPADTGDFVINPTALQTALNNGAITLQADNSITISNFINSSGNANSNTLTFQAPIINLNASVNTNGSQVYNGGVTIGTTSVTLTTNNNNVTFANTVNSAASANNSLAIAAGTSTVNFNNEVGTGANGALNNLNITSGGIQLNTTTTNNLNINASGFITQNGDLTVGGTTTLAAGGNDITLDGNNNFNTVQITSGGNVSLNDINALNLGTSNITGTLNVNTNGAITQSGNLTIAGTTTLDANNSSITLNGANNLSTVQINGTNNVSLNDVNAITLDSSTINGNLNLTANEINIPTGATITSNNGNITLNGTTSVTSSGSLTASGRTVQILGSNLALLGGSEIDVSGPTGGTALVGVTQGPGNTFNIVANTVTVLPTATINANSTTSPTGGTIIVRANTNQYVFPNGITANGSQGNPTGNIQLPPNSTIDPTVFSNVDPTTSFFSNITIVDGNGQFIITDLVNQGLLPAFFVPFVQNDPIFAQLLTSTINQNFQIPQSVLEGTTTSILSGFLTGQNILLTARNNITVQDLTAQGVTTNQLTFAPRPLPGSIQLAAGGVFSMNQGDTLQTSGRSLAISANGIPASNSLTIGSINTSSTTQQAGNIQLAAATGNIAIGNGINPVSILGNSANNTAPTSIQIQAAAGTVNVNSAIVQANSSTANSLAGQMSIAGGTDVNLVQTAISTSNGLGRAGQVSINAPNTVNLNQTDVTANGQFGSINIGSATSRPSTVLIQNNSNLAARNDQATPIPGVVPVAGSVNVQANSSVQVNQSRLSSSASGVASAGAIAIQTTNNASGNIAVLNSTLESTASGSGGAGAIDVQNASTITLGGSTIANTVVDGTGGVTRINGGTVQINGNTTIQADTSGTGDAGNINITATAVNPTPATSALTINNSQVRASTSSGGSAGTVSLNSTSGDIAVSNNSTVSTSSTATGFATGGAGTVDVQATGKVTVDNSNIANTVVDGAGGNITVTAQQVALQNNSQVNTSTSGTGDAGAIDINATAADPSPTTAALTIDNSSVTAITSPNARATVGTFNQGDAGQVTLGAANGSIAIANSSKISSSTTGNINAPGFGNGGLVTVTGQNLSLLGGSVIQARSDGTAAPGSIAVEVPNTIRVAGTNASGQVSEISTFSGANADLSNPSVGDIQINQPGTPVQHLELSDRGRINASTESTQPDFTGGSIQIYADNVRLTSGGQVVASSLNGSSPTSAQAGNIDLVVTNNLEISGSRPAFVDDPNFSAALSLTRFGNVDANGTLLSNSGGLDLATLATALGLPSTDPLLANAFDGSGIQLSAPGTTPRNLTFNWNFSTNESPGFFNDTSFYSVNGGALTRLADASGNPGAPNPIAPAATVGNGNVVNIGVVNVGDTAVASSLRLSNLTVNGQPAQILVSSPDIDPTRPFISGIFARADGTGNAGTVTITGTQPTTRTSLSDGGQISTSTNSGGSTAPSNITLSGLNSLSTASNSSISASTNSGVAGNVQINVTQGSNPAINLTGNSAIAATATNGGNAGSISITTPTFGMNDGATVGVSSANGAGIAGSITLNANTVNLTNARISAETDAGGATSPASINLEGLRTLQLNNAEISAVTQTGRAGNVSVSANRAIALNNSLLSVAGAGATGNSGNVTLTTPELTVNNSQISASTVGGTGGDVTLQGLNTLQVDNGRVTASTKSGQAGSLSVNTSSAIALNNNSLLSVEATELTGNSGRVTLTTPQLTLNNSQISASTVGGTGGDVTLQGLNTFQANNGRVTASTQSGQAGNLSISASGAIALNNNSLVSVEATEATGNSGKVTLTTPQLTLTNSQISASTVGGTGGDVTLQGLNTFQANNGRVTASTQSGQAGNLSISASGAIALNNNSLVSVEATEATGNSGKVTLSTPQLTVTNSQISASTVGGVGGDITLEGLNTLQVDSGRVTASTKSGQAGNLSVSASNAIALNNNSLLSVEATEATGNSGKVTLTTPNLTVNNSQISASTVGGIGGGIALQGLDALELNDSQVTASTKTGQAGNLSVNVNETINLTNRSKLAVEADGANGIAGNVAVQGQNINLRGNSEISSSARGDGAIAGNVTINGRRITVQSSLIKASSQQGPAGEIILTADRLDLNRGELLAEIGRNATGRTGGIKLSVNNQLNLDNESRISTLGRNGANGGDITILKVRFLFAKPATGPNGSDIVGRADGGGQGGRVFLDRATLVQGFLFRRAVDGNRTNDIDTNGQLVNLSTNADVGARGLATPLVVFNDVSRIVTSACEAVGVKPTEGSAELKITGRGGAPISPAAPLPAQAPGSDWVTLELAPQVPVSITLPNGSTAVLKPGEIYELQATCVDGWKLRQRSLL